jgi:hypothetical protein
MGIDAEAPLDELWKEYGEVFRDFDDLTLARWMAQTLGQLEGKVWRYTHPLVSAYRLAAHLGHERQVWLKRLATPPAAYVEAPCCRAPALPLLTRDVGQAGLICLHCNETLFPLEELNGALGRRLKEWAGQYAEVHEVAHWEEDQRSAVSDYAHELEAAAEKAEALLRSCGKLLAPALLDFYPAVIWEDQDECLEVSPEDIPLN